MGKIIGLVGPVWTLVAKYPAISAGLFNVLVIAGAQVGLHLTTNQLASVAGFVAALMGLLVTAGVIPVHKVANVKAGLRSTVPTGVNVAVPQAVSAPDETHVDTEVPIVRTPTVESPVLVAPVVSEPASPDAEPGQPAEPVEAERALVRVKLGKPINTNWKRN